MTDRFWSIVQIIAQRSGSNGDGGLPGRLGRTLRLFKVYVRFGRYLLWEFRWPLIVFWTLVFGGGLVVHLTYHHDGETLSYMEASYGVFLLIFVEAHLEFPDEWYLQILFFIIPIVGLGAIADSLVRLGFLLVTRKNNLPEWHRMVASLYRNHTVVIGLGTVGYQIVHELLSMREPVVVVERPSADTLLIDEMVDLEVPIIRGDGRTPKTLEHAGVTKAKAVILATQDDLTNLDAGLTARDLNKDARIVLRLFDESLAQKVQGAFAMPAISTAKVAAPAFVAAATGRRLYQDFELAGRHLHLIDLRICPEGGLVGKTVGEIQADRQVNIVMHHGASGTNVNPHHDVILGPNDEVLVIAPIDRLIAMEALNQPTPVQAESPR